MSSLPVKGASDQFSDGVDTAAATLKQAGENAREFSEHAGEAMREATTEFAKKAESVRSDAVDAGKDAMRYAKREVETHPRATLAAGLTAFAAIISLLIVNRRNRRASR